MKTGWAVAWYLTAVTALIVSLVVIPATTGAAAAPAGPRSHTDATVATQILRDHGISDPRLTVVTIEGMTGVDGRAAAGYVNLFERADVIYMRPYDRGDRARYADNLLHEYGHVLQKRLMIERSPLGWYQRPATLDGLDGALTRMSPLIVRRPAGAMPLDRPGLEANADCIGTLLSGTKLYATGYVTAGSCDSRALRAASDVIAGRWPGAAPDLPPHPPEHGQAHR